MCFLVRCAKSRVWVMHGCAGLNTRVMQNKEVQRQAVREPWRMPWAAEVTCNLRESNAPGRQSCRDRGELDPKMYGGCFSRRTQTRRNCAKFHTSPCGIATSDLHKKKAPRQIRRSAWGLRGCDSTSTWRVHRSFALRIPVTESQRQRQFAGMEGFLELFELLIEIDAANGAPFMQGGKQVPQLH